MTGGCVLFLHVESLFIFRSPNIFSGFKTRPHCGISVYLVFTEVVSAGSGFGANDEETHNVFFITPYSFSS